MRRRKIMGAMMLAGVTAWALSPVSWAAEKSKDAAAAEPAATAYLIDVRTPQEFAQGHLEGAVNIEYQEIVGRIGEVTRDKNARIELYCRSGRRSGIAQAALQKAGYAGAIDLGGFETLRQNRRAVYPAAKP